MTGDNKRADQHGPDQFRSLDLLAELHANAVNGESDEELRRLTSEDPDAGDIVAALDMTVAQLRALPPISMPDDVAARIDVALAAEAAAHQPVVSPPIASVTNIAEARRRRARRLSWGGAGLGVVAAAAVALVVLLPSFRSPTGQSIAEPPTQNSTSTRVPTIPVPTVTPSPGEGQALMVPIASQSIGINDPGQLDTPQKLSDCLAANSVDPKTKPLGIRQVKVQTTENGKEVLKPGIMMILPTGQAQVFRLLIVGPTCSAGNPATYASSTTS